MPERICPMCGRSSSEVEFIGNLCKDCFVKKYGVAQVPQQVEVTYCASCHAHRISGRWSDPYQDLEESLEDFLYAYLSGRVKPVPPIEEVTIKSIRVERAKGAATAYVELQGSYRGVTVEETAVVSLVMKATLCPVCASRRSGEGYTAIVQVRAYPRRIEDVRGLRRALDKLIMSVGDDVVKVEELKEGLDVYLRDHQGARVLASRLRSEFNAKVIETYKGRGDRTRLYVSVRLATVSPGDVLDVGGEPMFYLGDSRNGMLLVDLGTGRRVFRTPDELWSDGFKLYEGPELTGLRLISAQGGTYVFVGDGGESLEVPKDRVEPFVESLEEGQRFIAFLSRSRVYLLRREEEVAGEAKGR